MTYLNGITKSNNSLQFILAGIPIMQISSLRCSCAGGGVDLELFSLISKFTRLLVNKK